ncbi:hypothetical protein [Parasitella parasitica]|uniref:CCHC-type domain-containing protein n=1 Tax=Parasitella parasitica TaxID=35722 RepID=A0A0B7NGT7_9FUNG|nr:hypothetical protein [Parasitella parasitica]
MFLSFFKCFFRCCLRDTTTECDNLGVIEVEAPTLDTTQNKTKFRQEIIGNIVPQTNNCLREDGFQQYLDQVSTCCQGCGQAFSSNVKSLAYNPFPHGHCYSCTRILREIKKLDIPGRLNRFTKNGAIYIEHEAKFMNYLHQHKTQSHAELMKGSFYHLPLSTNYYRKQMDETTGLYTKFVYHKSFPEENSVSHFINCNGCKNFVATKRRTLIKTTQYARTRYKICIPSHVASSNDLFALMGAMIMKNFKTGSMDLCGNKACADDEMSSFNSSPNPPHPRDTGGGEPLNSTPLADFSQGSVANAEAQRRDSRRQTHVSFMDTRSIPDEESLMDSLRLTKEQYEVVVQYVNKEQAVARTTPLMPPVEHPDLQEVISGEQQAAQFLRQEVAKFDGQLKGERAGLNNPLVYLSHTVSGGEVNSVVQELQWPTYDVCQELGLPQDYFLLSQKTYYPTVTIQRGGTDSAHQLVDTGDYTEEMVALKKRIAFLEAQLTRNLNTGNVRKESTPLTTRLEEKESKDMKQVYTDRCKRHKFTHFEKDSAFEAEQWIQRNEVLANYIGFSDEEKAEELVGVFTGAALDWLIGLDLEVKSSWDAVKASFLRQHVQGEDPALAAFNELKSYKQGNKEILYLPNIVLDYLKDRFEPNLAKAVIMARVTTLAEGIKVATDIKRSLINAHSTAYMGPIKQQVIKKEVNYQKKRNNVRHNTYGSNSRGFGYRGSGSRGSGSPGYGFSGSGSGGRDGIDKHKEERKCFECGKVGHIRKDCWQREEQNNSQKLVDEEETPNIFAHFVQNNSQQSHINQQHTGFKSFETGSRLKVEVLFEKDVAKRPVLIDTGATISTITRAMADELRLEQSTTTNAVISYEKQSEDLILGMDWMGDENLVIHTRTKKISKTPTEAINNSSELSKILTTAPYRHSIDTGDAKPIVTRDFRRSPAENEAIAKEVETMLKKKVIVPSNSNWCSPVILIKKPDGTFRFCVDYRNLNKVVLRGYKYFSSCDLKSGFWQLPPNDQDGSSKKTAFQANGSLYEFNSLPYGISTGPSSFARLMSIVLKGLPRTINFCDDCLIFSHTYEQHVEDVTRVLERMNSNNLKISEKKCQWFQPEVKFLRFLVNGEGIRSNPEKVAVVKQWKGPRKQEEFAQISRFCRILL